MQHLPAHIRRVLAREEQQGRGHLVRLPGATKGRVLPEFLNLIGGERGWDQRCPDRSRRHAVDQNTLGREFACHRAQEGQDRPLVEA